LIICTAFLHYWRTKNPKLLPRVFNVQTPSWSGFAIPTLLVKDLQSVFSTIFSYISIVSNLQQHGNKKQNRPGSTYYQTPPRLQRGVSCNSFLTRRMQQVSLKKVTFFKTKNVIRKLQKVLISIRLIRFGYVVYVAGY